MWRLSSSFDCGARERLARITIAHNSLIGAAHARLHLRVSNTPVVREKWAEPERGCREFLCVRTSRIRDRLQRDLNLTASECETKRRLSACDIV